MAVTIKAQAGNKVTVAPRGVQGVKALPKKATLAIASVVPAVVSSPALALVDQRMNGDGAGLILGVNEPILGYVVVGVFGIVWALYASSAKSFGAQDEEDGLGL